VTSDTWIGLTTEPVPVDAAAAWVVEPRCGGTVVFNGTARDHSDGRPEVSVLEYEAYEEHVVPRLAAIADETRVRWPDVGRIAMIHRMGRVGLGESAVVVAVGAPHRDDAFAAARFCIDTLKATVPIWKREVWRDGESWGLEPQHVHDVGELAGADDGDRS
jgi:molybdopterin synthase catalytic subunit